MTTHRLGVLPYPDGAPPLQTRELVDDAQNVYDAFFEGLRRNVGNFLVRQGFSPPPPPPRVPRGNALVLTEVANAVRRSEDALDRWTSAEQAKDAALFETGEISEALESAVLDLYGQLWNYLDAVRIEESGGTRVEIVHEVVGANIAKAKQVVVDGHVDMRRTAQKVAESVPGAQSEGRGASWREYLAAKLSPGVVSAIYESPKLLDDMKDFLAAGGNIVVVPDGRGIYYQPATRTITFGGGSMMFGPEYAVNSLAHELGHALFNENAVLPRPDGMTLAQYKAIAIEVGRLSEGAAKINEIDVAYQRSRYGRAPAWEGSQGAVDTATMKAIHEDYRDDPFRSGDGGIRRQAADQATGIFYDGLTQSTGGNYKAGWEEYAQKEWEKDNLNRPHSDDNIEGSPVSEWSAREE